MRKIALDMDMWVGLTWCDSETKEIFHKGQGLSTEENKRLDEYFSKYRGRRFDRAKAIELAQYALDNVKIPENFETE